MDILDDTEPLVLVQKYIYPDRTFQVFRKSTSPAEVFNLSPGVEIDPDMFWSIGRILFETADELDDDMTELFALAYLDEENPPTYDVDKPSDVDPHVCIAYDADVQQYYCEPTLIVDDNEMEDITSPSMDAVITRAVDALHTGLAQKSSKE